MEFPTFGYHRLVLGIAMGVLFRLWVIDVVDFDLFSPFDSFLMIILLGLPFIWWTKSKNDYMGIIPKFVPIGEKFTVVSLVLNFSISISILSICFAEALNYSLSVGFGMLGIFLMVGVATFTIDLLMSYCSVILSPRFEKELFHE